MNAFAGLGWSPLVPGWWLGVLAALAFSIWALGLWRGARGAWLRLLPLAMLVVALANPRLVAEDRLPLPDIALVVVDDSPSQGIGDRRAETEAALAALAERLARQPNLEVRTERVRGGAGDDGTRLFAAIERALADVPRRRLAGVVMITDGRVHDVPADKAAALGAPLHALVTGRPGERDRRLVVTQSPGFALVGKAATITLKVEEVGATGSAPVEIKVDGKPYLAAPVPLNREAAIEVPVRHAGTTVIELAAAESPAGELSLTNNRTALGISGVRDRLKVLLISGEPHAGERTWRNLLKADPSVDLVHFTILRPPEKDDRTPIRELALITFPVRELFEEKLADFDLVVFDRYRRRGVLAGGYYERLARYVEQGGALLMAVGPEFAEADGLAGTGLADILPALPTGEVLAQAFRPQVTHIGRRHPVTSGLTGGGGAAPSWGSWMRQVVVSGERGTAVLAGIGGRPLVVLDKVGEGRVAQVLSDTIWLWSRGFEGGGPHDELLRRLAHWLMREPELEEEALSAELKGDRLEVLRRSLLAAPASVTVTRPDGSTVPLPLDDHGDGRATAALAIDQPGLWRVDDGVRTAIAAAGSLAPVEQAELAATTDLLAPVADATGGSVRYLVSGGMPDLRRVGPGRIAAGRDWIGLAAQGDHVVTGVREVPLAPGLMVLLLALGGLLAAWKREGR
jgi:hypothetical protein